MYRYGMIDTHGHMPSVTGDKSKYHTDPTLLAGIYLSSSVMADIFRVPISQCLHNHAVCLRSMLLVILLYHT